MLWDCFIERPVCRIYIGLFEAFRVVFPFHSQKKQYYFPFFHFYFIQFSLWGIMIMTTSNKAKRFKEEKSWLTTIRIIMTLIKMTITHHITSK